MILRLSNENFTLVESKAKLNFKTQKVKLIIFVIDNLQFVLD